MRAVTGGMGSAGSLGKAGPLGGGDQGPFGGGDQGPFGGNGDQGPFGGNGDQGPFGGNGDQGPFGGNGDQGPFGGNGQSGVAPQPQVAAVGSNVIVQRTINFRIEIQEQSEWCWAAVALSVEKFFNPASTLEQCDVANKVLPKEYPGQDLPESDCPCCCHCCCNPDSCDLPAQLEVALQQVHKWRKTLLRPLTFEEIQREIDAGRPIGVAITWQSGNSAPNPGAPNPTGHFVVVRGYRELSSGARQVYVGDPLNPSGLVELDEFTLAYYGDGTWAASYLLQSGRA